MIKINLQTCERVALENTFSPAVKIEWIASAEFLQDVISMGNYEEFGRAFVDAIKEGCSN